MTFAAFFGSFVSNITAIKCFRYPQCFHYIFVFVYWKHDILIMMILAKWKFHRSISYLGTKCALLCLYLYILTVKCGGVWVCKFISTLWNSVCSVSEVPSTNIRKKRRKLNNTKQIPIILNGFEHHWATKYKVDVNLNQYKSLISLWMQCQCHDEFVNYIVIFVCF